MNLIDKKVEEIWRGVNEKNPALMFDWIRCFGENYHEGIRKSKEEVKMSLTRRECQVDPEKNFLWKLMSSEPCKYGYVDTKGYFQNRSDLAALFVQVMTGDLYFDDFLATTMSLGNSHKFNLAISAPASEDITTQSPLHNAAILENVERVRYLVEKGEEMKINPNGFTPLHFAAMAIYPQPEITRQLIMSVNGKALLDRQTKWEECGGNTALHLAAANVKVTAQFIQQFKYADWKISNFRKHTPFHVAAKSNNPEAIIYMLNTFCTKNYLQDLNMVDSQNTLIKICARKGNAAAVALLIEHGADIADGVLYEIVLESVRNPRKIEDLKRVYHSVVDNVVTWRNLRKEGQAEPEPEFLLVMCSVKYEARFRKTMFWLLTSRSADYVNQSVLECALSHGAFAMVWEIIHTRSVFRLQGNRTRQYVEATSVNAVKKTSLCPCVETKYDDSTRCQKNWTVFDITNFTEETHNKVSGRPQYEDGEHALEPDAEENEDNVSERIALRQNAEENAEPRNARNINFDEPGVPNEPYLTCLLSASDQWRSSNILSTQPFSELMKPYIVTVQRFYFVLGLVQLIFMLIFTVYWMPTTCSLALMFNVSATGCSSSTRNDSDDAMLSSFSKERSWITMLWLIWPLILFSKHVFMSYHYVRLSCSAHAAKLKKIVTNTKDLKSTLFNNTLRTLLIRKLPVKIFCFTVVGWLYVYFWSESHELYAQVTSMVLLFGWITNVSFFGSVTKNVSIFNLVLKRIIEKDISGFMLFFGFNVVGFSFAMHTVRMSVCMQNQIIHFHDTFFAVLLSAFRIGDFFDSTITDSTCVDVSGSTQNMFEFVYLGYVCATIITLLNILIAMLNNRYARAKQKADNVWRFEMLFMMTTLKRMNCFGCCPKLTSESYHYNEELDRHYLVLPVPVNEQLKTVAPPGSQGSQVISRSIRP